MKTVKANLIMTILILLTICLLVGCRSKQPESRTNGESEPNEVVEREKAVGQQEQIEQIQKIDVVVEPDVAEPNKPVEPNKVDDGFDEVFEGMVGPTDSNRPSDFSRGGRRDRGGFGDRVPGGRREFNPLERLDPNDIENLKEKFPDLDFSDPNALRENQEAMGAIRELMRERFMGAPGRIDREGRRGPRRLEDPNVRDFNAPDPNELVALDLKEVTMSTLIQRLGEWTGKTVIPHDDLMKQKITVHSPKRIPRYKALEQIYRALGEKGFTHVEDADSVTLKPSDEAKLEKIPVISGDEPLATFKDKTLIVQKSFKLESYSVIQMAQIIQPLVGKHGYISSDETSGILLVIDTVGNLIRFEMMIEQFDIPEAGEETAIRIIPIEYGDPVKIVQFLNQLLGEESTTGPRSSRSRSSSDRFRRSSSSFSRQTSSSGSSSSERPREVKKPTATGATTSVSIAATKGPVILLADPERRQIIVRASPADIERIEEWIHALDVKTDVESQWEVVDVNYVSATEIEDSVENNLRDRPEELRPIFSIDSLPQAKKVIITGDKGTRELIKKLIREADVPVPVPPEKTIHLEYLDPDEVKEKLEEIYPSLTTVTRGGFSPFGGFRGGRETSAEGGISVTSLPSQGAVTVRASSKELLEQVEARVKEWDKPIEFYPPRIIDLKNTDPVKMSELLNNLFGGEQGAVTSAARGRSIFDLLTGRGEVAEKIIGRLYGKVTFKEVPDAKKIIVICTIPEMYDKIEQFVEELDEAEIAEMPKPVVLKYADCEDLAERLNAMFNEPGTTARIQRSEVGVLEQTIQVEEVTAQQQQQQQQQAAPGEYTPWWSQSGARTRIGEEMPISNVIGRVRFVPDPRMKAILVLAPLEYTEGIVQLIEELDKPGKQVVVKVVVVEVDKSKLDSVGLQIASGQTAFGTLGENSVTALNQITRQISHGSMIFGAGGTSGVSFAIDMAADVSTLIDFLVKYTNGRVLNRQTIWTKDNETGEFFKGKEISLLGQSSVSGAGGIVTQGFEPRKVGITVRTKPNITPEGDVDLIIYLALSQLSQDLVNAQPVLLETETKTNMIVKDGQTILLGSILTQEDTNIRRKIPGLSDLPLVGGLFQHNSGLKLNSEMLVFITPIVVDEESDAEQVPEVKEALEKKAEIQEHLNKVSEWLEKEVE